MNVLVIDATRQDRDLAVKWLTDAGHRVDSAMDARGTYALLERALPEVAVVDWGMPSAQEVVKRLRAMDTSGHTYIVACSADRTPTDLVASINSGADDYIRKPLLRDELITRVGGIDRIRRWASRILGSAPIQDWSTGPNIPQLRAWKEADRAFTRDVEAMLGESLEVHPDPTALAAMQIASDLPLNLAAEELEVRVTVGLAPAALKHLAATVLGDEAAPESALRDIVREFANTAAGAFKQAALDEGLTLTTGLPVDHDVARAAQQRPAAQQDFLVRSTATPLAIGFRVAVLSRSLVRVTVAQLREGMVLARDLLNEAGALLVPAGTRLTQSQIERVTRVVPSRVAIDVADAA